MTNDAALPAMTATAPRPPRLSRVLRDLAMTPGAERISVGELIAALKGRAFGALLLVLSLPSVVPAPPGVAAVMSIPILFLSVQMVLGQKPWFPAFIARRTLPRAAFAALTIRAAPLLRRIERLLKARLLLLTTVAGQHVLGLICLLLTLVLLIPVPFGNPPPALALCLIGLGLMERDGVAVIAGLVVGAGAVAYVGALGYGIVLSALSILGL